MLFFKKKKDENVLVIKIFRLAFNEGNTAVDQIIVQT